MDWKFNNIDNRKLNIRNQSVEKYKNRDDEFEQNRFSKTPKGIYQIG